MNPTGPTSASIIPGNPGNPENRIHARSGGPMLIFNLGLMIAGITLLIHGIQTSAETNSFSLQIPLGIVLDLTGILCLVGHFTLQPNEARVMILFGSYHGTVRTSGFFWANPFYSRVRARIPFAGGESRREHAAALRPG
jgi:hypothetical protein